MLSAEACSKGRLARIVFSMISTGTGSKGGAVAALQTICRHNMPFQSRHFQGTSWGWRRLSCFPCKTCKSGRGSSAGMTSSMRLGDPPPHLSRPSRHYCVVQMRSKGPTALTEKLLEHSETNVCTGIDVHLCLHRQGFRQRCAASRFHLNGAAP